jgi:hypothetical protein
MFGDLIHYLSPLRKGQLYFCKKKVPLVIKDLFNEAFVHDNI